MRIDSLGAADVGRVIGASALFDRPASDEWANRFLTSPAHHLLLAVVDDRDVGFISGVELTHPDKGTEMFLYELGVDETARGRGVATALVAALRDLAVARGCYGMWVATESDHAAALATYRRGGAGEPEPAVVLSWAFDSTR